jgi:DnaJ-class molecular chaperone
VIFYPKILRLRKERLIVAVVKCEKCYGEGQYYYPNANGDIYAVGICPYCGGSGCNWKAEEEKEEKK